MFSLLSVIENMLFQSESSLDCSLPLPGELPSKQQIDLVQQKMAFNGELFRRLDRLLAKVT